MAAQHMRSKQYPPLPQPRDRRLSVVLPRAGDLRFRSLLPGDFRRLLLVHADGARRGWYARFSLERRFIVMSTDGDLYTHSVRMRLSGRDVRLLAMPVAAPGAMLRVLDLAVCRAHAQWEIAFVRWRNGMTTWLPAEVVHATHPHLLQEFYVNSINSWALRNRVSPEALVTHQTEVELWLFHAEFQGFYRALRRRREQRQQHTADVKPVVSDAASAQQTTAYRIPPAGAAATQQRTLLGPGDGAARAAAAQLPPHVGSSVHVPRGLSAQQSSAFEPSRLLYQELQHQQGQQQQQLLHQQYLQKQRQRQVYQHGAQQVGAQLQFHVPRTALPQQRQHAAHAPQAQLGQRTPMQRPAAVRQDPATQPVSSRSWQREPYPEPAIARESRSSAVSSRPGFNNPSDRQRGAQARTGQSNTRIEESAAPRSEPAANSSSQIQDRSRLRKRLARSHVDDEDEDEDLPDLSLGPATVSLSKTTPTAEKTSDSNSSSHSERVGDKRKSRKRLRQSHAKSPSGEKDVDVTILEIDISDKDTAESQVQHLQVHGHDRSHEHRQNNNHSRRTSRKSSGRYDDGSGIAGGALSILEAEEAGRQRPEDIAAANIVGKIRCSCGATAVNEYRGRWVQCTSDDCRLWQHADCVGALTKAGDKFEVDKFRCSKCDQRGYLLRRAEARLHMVDWMFQCCESFNSNQLLMLINDVELARKNGRGEWQQCDQNRMNLLMKAARHGLTECVAKLLDKSIIKDIPGGVLAKDTLKQNALHHAALGESASCCELLLQHTHEQIKQADLNGVTPFHLMLRSPLLNHLCMSSVQMNEALLLGSDAKSNHPIHYACMAVNRSTPKILRRMLAFQSSMLHEKSEEGLSPLMILCRSTPRSVGVGGITPSAVAECFKQSLDVILDVDVFGLCLGKKTVHGWTVAHFAAAAGNHEVLAHLGNTGEVNLDAAAHEGLTPLHIAAAKNHTACVRRLLEFGVNIMAKDSAGVIPMLFTADAACMQEFMHYKLTKHLSRLHRMLPRHQHQGLVRQWQRRAVLDPTCFDMLNDWCNVDLDRIERVDGIFLSTRYMLRLDNKLEFIREYVIPSLRRPQVSAGPAKKLQLTFSSAEKASFWRQFVHIATRLEPVDFRFPFVFAMTSSRGTTLKYEGTSVKLVLIRLAADLLRQEQGVLLRGNHEGDVAASGASVLSLSDASEDDIRALLVDFYVLGELMAHLVLFSIPSSNIFNFSPWFLDGVFATEEDGLYSSDHASEKRQDSCWATLGRSFRLGFQAVLPSVLPLMHADEFRVLQNSESEITLNACAIDWDSAVEWVVEDADGAVATDKATLSDAVGASDGANEAAKWFARLSTELVAEEQQLLLLRMTQTLPAANALFFPKMEDEGNQQADCSSTRKRVRVVVGDAKQRPECAASGNGGGKLPFMCHKSRTLYLPRYLSYDLFKASILRMIRRLDRAFMSAYD